MTIPFLTLARQGAGLRAELASALEAVVDSQGLGLGPGALPVSEQLARSEISLPMFPELTDDEAERVARAVRAACQSVGR